MIDTQTLKFACAFCHYNSDYKTSVKNHFRNCTEKYNSRIDLTNPNFFRMIDAKYCIKNIKIKNKKKQLDIKDKRERLYIKEKRERDKSIKYFFNSKIVKKEGGRISKCELLKEYLIMYPFNKLHTVKHMAIALKDDGFIYKYNLRIFGVKGCFIDVQFRQKDASIFLHEKINMLKRHNALTASKILIDNAFIELQKREMGLFK